MAWSTALVWRTRVLCGATTSQYRVLIITGLLGSVWVRVGNGDYSSFATKLAVMSEQKKYSTDNPFRPELWHSVEGFEDLTDITYHRLNAEGRKNGIVRIAFDRPEVRLSLIHI